MLNREYKRSICVSAALCWVLVGAASGLAARAQAAPFTPELNLAYRIAINYWGEPGNCTTVDAQLVPRGDIILAGRATIPTSPQPCELEINDLLISPTFENFNTLCVVMVHEVGHLHGMGHSPDPGNVMYSEGDDFLPERIIPLCLVEQRRREAIWLARFDLRQKLAVQRRVALLRRIETLTRRFWEPLYL